jgi:hypothetical protein
LLSTDSPDTTSKRYLDDGVRPSTVTRWTNEDAVAPRTSCTMAAGAVPRFPSATQRAVPADSTSVAHVTVNVRDATLDVRIDRATGKTGVAVGIAGVAVAGTGLGEGVTGIVWPESRTGLDR